MLLSLWWEKGAIAQQMACTSLSHETTQIPGDGIVHVALSSTDVSFHLHQQVLFTHSFDWPPARSQQITLSLHCTRVSSLHSCTEQLSQAHIWLPGDMSDMQTQEFLPSASVIAAWLKTTGFPRTCLIFESMLSFSTALLCYSPNPVDLWSLQEQFPLALASKQLSVHETPAVILKNSEKISK